VVRTVVAVRTRSPRAWLGSLALGAVVVVLMSAGFRPAGAVVIGFVVLTPLELLFRRHRQPVRRRGLRTDVVHFLLTGLLNGAATVVGVGLVSAGLRRFTVVPVQQFLAAMPVALQFVSGLAVFEVMGYWYHRLSHEVPFLWRFHSVHHSSENLDWISAARLHPLEGLFSGLVIGPPLVLLGFQPVTVPAITFVLTSWAVLLHANLSWRLGFLDGIVGTPEYHHWHHSNHPEAWNHNYSALLPPLDRLFGTHYQPAHRRPEGYGTEAPVPDGWFAQLVHPFRRKRSVSVSAV
jgi:sterol desaturase/sphingolipid hydroxylase (fatty acid hydroxylase superfamily)